MLEYIKSVIRSFFSTSTPISFIEQEEGDVVGCWEVKKPTKKKKTLKKKSKARKKTSSRALYPYRETAVGNGFLMKNTMNGSVYRALKDEGIIYRQHRCKSGVLAFRVA